MRRSRAEWRGGSAGRGWSARGWESGESGAGRLMMPRDRRLTEANRAQIELDVHRRREWRGRRSAVTEIGSEDALPKKRLRLGLGPCAALSDSWARRIVRRAEQHELQSSSGQPGQQQVARPGLHGV